MKVKSKVISAVIIAVAVIFTVGLRVSASEYIDDTDLPKYTVEEVEGVFSVTCGEDKSEGSDLSSLISAIPDGASIFFSDVSSSAPLDISGNKKIYGYPE